MSCHVLGGGHERIRAHSSRPLADRPVRCMNGRMSDTIHAVVEQLSAEQEQLQRRLEEKELEAQGIKTELQRVQEAISALTSKARSGSTVKPSATRSELLTMVHDALRAHGGTLSAKDLKETLRKSLKRSGHSARGLHKVVPHVLAHESLRVEGEVVTLRV